MWGWPPFTIKKTSLEKPREPHGKVISAKGGRGQVSGWLLPSRRDRCAWRAAARQRWLLACMAAFLGGYAAWGASTAQHVLIGAAAFCLAGSLVSMRWAWLRITPPALVLLGVVLDAFLDPALTSHDMWAAGSLVGAMLMLVLSWDALRIDAVRAVGAPPPRAGDGRERIQVLRVWRVGAAISMVGLIAGACLLFYALLPEM